MLATMACLFILLWIGSKGAIVTRLQFSYNKGVWSVENNRLPKVAGRRKQGEPGSGLRPPPSGLPLISDLSGAGCDQHHAGAGEAGSGPHCQWRGPQTGIWATRCTALPMLHGCGTRNTGQLCGLLPFYMNKTRSLALHRVWGGCQGSQAKRCGEAKGRQ